MDTQPANTNQPAVPDTMHVPVLMDRVLAGLDVQPDGLYWDGTFGNGGHSGAVLQRLNADGRLIASDRDPLAARYARRFDGDPRFRFIPGTLDEVLNQLPDGLNGFLWDLGVSTNQLKDPGRGFSFMENGPLDMRMSDSGPSAADLVNRLKEEELADLIYKYGEERLSRRIAARIVSVRREEPIRDTATLAEICKKSYPRRYHRIHPATRTFQALRIAVNEELRQVEDTLPAALAKLGYGGRAVVISFHSLEDRIVKHCFRDIAKQGGYRVLTKKPEIAGEEELRENPAARSAKLRVLVKEHQAEKEAR